MFELLFPWYLAAVPALVVFLWLGQRSSRHPMGPARRCSLTGLRFLAGVLVLLWLTVPLVRLTNREAVVVAVLDASRSQGQAGWQAQGEALATALEGLPGGTRVGVVAAGERPRVLRHPAVGRPTAAELEAGAFADGSDFAAALRLAAGLCPPTASGRLLLLGDGWATRGNTDEAVRAAASRGLRLDTLAVAGPAAPDARVVALRTSHSRLHQGATLALEAEVVSSLTGAGRARLYENGIEVATSQLELAPGDRRHLRFERFPRDRGLYTYRVRLEGFADDSLPANDVGLAYVDVRGQPLVLVLTEEPDEARHFQAVLAREGLGLVVRRPQAMPRSLTELIGFDAVVIANVAAYDLGDAAMALLRDYVEQLGGGLLMVGGERSFAAGGYYRTALEEVLPVKMRANDKEEQKPTALMLVLDRSGSMDGMKISMCKTAAQATLELLRGKDWVGVVSFDSQPHWTVPFGRMSPAAVAAIDSISAGGGTDIHIAMSEAWRAMRGTSAAAKHMIVITDGHSSGGDFAALSSAIRQDGITISTVAIGGEADTNLLQAIAHAGEGTCYREVDPQQLKAIFTQDTLRHLGRVIREEPFVPVVAERHAMLDGYGDDAPALFGYVRTERRAMTQVPLVTDLGDPLLAHWRFGLGKVTAFTSGTGSRWAPLWISSWTGFGSFWAQVLRDTTRPPQGRWLDVHARSDGERAVIDIDLLETAAAFAHDAQVDVDLRVLSATTPGSQLSPATALAAVQVAPGRYRAEAPLGEAGVYLVQVRSGAHLASTGLVHAVAREIATGAANTDLLAEWAATGGGSLVAVGAPLPEWQGQRRGERVFNLQPWVLVALLVVLLADLVVRRWENVLGLVDTLGGGRRRGAG